MSERRRLTPAEVASLSRRSIWAIFATILVFWGLVIGSIFWIGPARAASTPSPSVAAKVYVPAQAAMYRRYVEQAVTDVWGVEGSSARLAAQLHQESAWRLRARSPVGAQGLAQFMPATAKWIAGLFPDQLGQFDPWDPRQAALAAAIYNDYLFKRVRTVGAGELTACSQWAFTLRAYNGGEKYLLRDRAMADKVGVNANDWRHVERFRSRGVSTHRENIGYPKRILLLLEPAYLAAGWGGLPTCETPV